MWLSLLVCSVQDEEEIEEEERREKESKAKSEFDKIQVRRRAANSSILLNLLLCLLPIVLSKVAMQSSSVPRPPMSLFLSWRLHFPGRPQVTSHVQIPRGAAAGHRGTPGDDLRV